MRPSFRPSVEALNDRLLPSSAPLPPTVADSTVLMSAASSFEVRLTTDRLTYRYGQPIQVTLIQTNVSNEPQIVSFGCLQHYDFWLMRNGFAYYHWSAHHPFQLCAVPNVPEVLAPGQSRSVSEQLFHPLSSPSYPLSGRYELYGIIDGVRSNPVSVTIESPLSASIETNRREYRLGRPVRIRFSVTNISDQPVRVNGICGGVGGPTIYDRKGELVYRWPFDMMTCASDSVLQPGQTLAYEVIWNSQFSFYGAPVKRGHYTVEVWLEGALAKTRFGIKAAKQ